MNWNRMDDILRFAIRKEADAAAFYRMAAGRSNPGTKKMFEALALEEEGHKAKLERFDPKQIDKMERKEHPTLGLAELLEDVPFSPDMSYADLLRMAIKNEEKAERLYHSMSRSIQDPSVNNLFAVLAQEEAAHKKRLEKMYDEEILTEF
jgi:rubrerythrin